MRVHARARVRVCVCVCVCVCVYLPNTKCSFAAIEINALLSC